MQRSPHILRTVIASTLLVGFLGGCHWFGKDSDLYTAEPRPLEVPPDLDRPNEDAAMKLPATASGQAAAAASATPATAGADGVISVASNVLPHAFRRLCDLSRDGQRDAAQRLDARLSNANEFLGVEPNPIPVKALLAHMGIGHGLRLPLLPLSSAHAARMASVAADILDLEHSIRDTIAA